MDQILVNGAILAANYALIALGITLIFSIMNVLNFAHGQMFMLGGLHRLLDGHGVSACPTPPRSSARRSRSG